MFVQGVCHASSHGGNAQGGERARRARLEAASQPWHATASYARIEAALYTRLEAASQPRHAPTSVHYPPRRTIPCSHTRAPHHPQGHAPLPALTWRSSAL